MKLEVLRYAAEHRDAWNALVRDAKNGLFLFDRNYLEYHSDRFTDMSAIAFADGEPAALLPASFDERSGLATSHGGLTFGGVILPRNVRGETALALIDACLDALRDWGAAELLVRILPSHLAEYPSAEVDYALWRRGFALVRRDLSSVIPLQHRLGLNSSKKQAVAKAEKAGLIVEAGPLAEFHPLLTSVLKARHGVDAIHSLAELELLANRFPQQIFLRSASHNGVMLAGVLIYRYPTAWHTQYMAASDEGRDIGALDKVIESAIDEAADDGAAWFSFGISTTDEGRALNEGLLWQKESFGARSVAHDFMRGRL
jgi:hypothetical protein